jgi:4-aminobutyrate aminotransferase-like enzyme
MNKVQHTSTLYINQPVVELAEKLAEMTPGRLQKSYFTNSGTEADETAVVLAKQHTGTQEVVTLRHDTATAGVLRAPCPCLDTQPGE